MHTARVPVNNREIFEYTLFAVPGLSKNYLRNRECRWKTDDTYVGIPRITANKPRIPQSDYPSIIREKRECPLITGKKLEIFTNHSGIIVRKNIRKKNTDGSTIFPFKESLSLTLISVIIFTHAWVQMVLERHTWWTESPAFKFFVEIRWSYSHLWKPILDGGQNYRT